MFSTAQVGNTEMLHKPISFWSNDTSHLQRNYPPFRRIQRNRVKQFCFDFLAECSHQFTPSLCTHPWHFVGCQICFQATPRRNLILDQHSSLSVNLASPDVNPLKSPVGYNDTHSCMVGVGKKEFMKECGTLPFFQGGRSRFFWPTTKITGFDGFASDAWKKNPTNYSPKWLIYHGAMRKKSQVSRFHLSKHPFSGASCQFRGGFLDGLLLKNPLSGQFMK